MGTVIYLKPKQPSMKVLAQRVIDRKPFNWHDYLAAIRREKALGRPATGALAQLLWDTRPENKKD